MSRALLEILEQESIVDEVGRAIHEFKLKQFPKVFAHFAHLYNLPHDSSDSYNSDVVATLQDVFFNILLEDPKDEREYTRRIQEQRRYILSMIPMLRFALARSEHVIQPTMSNIIQSTDIREDLMDSESPPSSNIKNVEGTLKISIPITSENSSVTEVASNTLVQQLHEVVGPSELLPSTPTKEKSTVAAPQAPVAKFISVRKAEAGATVLPVPSFPNNSSKLRSRSAPRSSVARSPTTSFATPTTTPSKVPTRRTAVTTPPTLKASTSVAPTGVASTTKNTPNHKSSKPTGITSTIITSTTISPSSASKSCRRATLSAVLTSKSTISSSSNTPNRTSQKRDIVIPKTSPLADSQEVSPTATYSTVQLSTSQQRALKKLVSPVSTARLSPSEQLRRQQAAKEHYSRFSRTRSAEELSGEDENGINIA
jgi:hypothetical protein